MKIIEVNLLPPEYAPESPFSVRNVAVLVVSFLIAGSLAVLAFQMLALRETYMKENARLIGTLTSFRREKQRLDTLLARKAELERRYSMVEEALGSRVTWSDKLADIWRSVPDGVWLEEVSVGKARAALSGGSVETSQLRMTGQSIDLSSIEKLLARIERMPYFEEAKFTSISLKNMGDQELYRFELTALLKGR